MARLLVLIISIGISLGSLWGSCWLYHYMHNGPEGYVTECWQDIPIIVTTILLVLVSLCCAWAAVDPTSGLPDWDD